MAIYGEVLESYRMGPPSDGYVGWKKPYEKYSSSSSLYLPETIEFSHCHISTERYLGGPILHNIPRFIGRFLLDVDPNFWEIDPEQYPLVMKHGNLKSTRVTMIDDFPIENTIQKMIFPYFRTIHRFNIEFSVENRQQNKA